MKTRAVRRAPALARIALAVTMAGAGVIVGLSGSTPAPATTTESASFSGLACTTGTTSSSSWGSATAPTNAVFADFTITGGGGAGGDTNAGGGGAGGAGGIVSGRIAVTGGQVLWAKLGCGGTDTDSYADWNNRRAGGWSRGGGAEDVRGGGGGGSTGLCLGTGSAGCSGGTMIAIAGGGGGGGRGSGTSFCSDQSGGGGGNANAGSDASAHDGTARGGGRGGKGSGSTPRGDGGGGGGGGGQGHTNGGATTADNAGGAAGPDVGGATNGNGMGGTPPVEPGESGAGGRGANGRNDITGGGGGGGYTGGGGGAGGEDGSCAGGNWNGAGGGGAGSSWARSSVTSRSFSTVSGTFSTCNDTLGSNVGRGANAGSGARGCHGYITVTWVKNAPPTGASASYTVNKGTPTAVTLAASDPDGDNPVTCEILDTPDKGTLGGSGCARSYTANNGTSGADTMTYRVVDSGNVASATYTITFDIVNRAPTGAAQTVSVTKGEAKTITLAATDLDNETVTCSTSNGPFKASLGGSGCSRTYTAPANSTGTDSFTYTVSDGIATNSYTVTLTIVNRTPTSANQDVYVGPGSVTAIALQGGDLDGDTTTCSTTAPSGGSLQGGASCTRNYTAPTTLGIYTFTYVRSDGAANSPTATVTIYVQSPDLTVTKSHVGTFNSGGQGTYTIGVENIGNAPSSGTITVTDALPSGMTFVSAAAGSSGFSCTANAGGTTVTCTRGTALAPATPVSFTITVAITEAAPSGTNTATVAATPDHNPGNNTATDPTTINRRPTANPVSAETAVDTPVEITLSGSDPEGGALTYQVGTPSSGGVTGTGPTVTFTPAPGSDAEVTFTYTVTDPNGHVSFVATVTVTVARPGVNGRVTSDDTGQGIGGITVRLYQDGVGFAPFSATTAADGSYDLGPTVPAGEYRVIFRDPTQDYVDEWYDDSQLRSTSTPITVDPSEELDVDAGLATGAQLQVTISNAGSFTVALYNTAPLGASAYRSVPNVSGSTTLRGLPAGTYYVSVTDPAGLLVPEWSGNQTQRGSAVGIPVTSSATGSAPFTLVTRNTIAGTIIDSEGPVPLVTVQAYGAVSGAFVKSTKTDAEGEYVIKDLAAGQYKLVFRDTSGGHQVVWYGGGDVISLAATVVMPNGGALTADAELTRTASIAGTVTGGAAGTTPLSGAKVTLYRDGLAVKTYTTDAEGGYVATGLLAGDYTALFAATGHRSEYNLDRPRRADADVIGVEPGDQLTLDATLLTS